jgi:hypothetical protein
MYLTYIASYLEKAHKMKNLQYVVLEHIFPAFFREVCNRQTDGALPIAMATGP